MSLVARLIGLGAGAGRQALSRVLPAGKERILANLESSAPEMMRRAAQKDTGFTFDPRRGKFLEAGEQAGSMMATVPNLPGQSSGLGTARNLDELLTTLRKPETVERFRRGEYIGAWNPAGEGVGLDPARRHLTRLGALTSGLKTGQMGGFDLARQIGYDVTPEALSAARRSMAARGGATVGGGLLAAEAATEGGVTRNFDNFVTGLRGETSGEANAAEALGGALRFGATDPLLLAGAVVPGVGKAAKGITRAAKGLGIDDALAAASKVDTSRPTSLTALLAATKAEGKGSTNPSDVANKVVAKLKSQVKTESITDAKGKTKEVKSLVFGVDNTTKYPDELKDLGLQPIVGYNYTDTGSSILKTDLPTTLEVLKSNIRSLAGKGGSRLFYTDINQALRSSTGNVLPGDRLGGAFAPFSAGSAVPANARLNQRFLENPELFPGRFPGEGSLSAGGAWKAALRSAGNENPLAPANFNAKGELIKIGSFAENVGIPEVSRAVTVDRHAVQAALGMRPLTDDTIPDLSNPKVYALFKQAYDEVAAELGIMPHELQSEVWDVWRRIMVRNPGASLPAEFVPTTKVSDLFKLPPAKFKKKMVDLLAKGGDPKSSTEAFFRAAGLLD